MADLGRGQAGASWQAALQDELERKRRRKRRRWIAVLVVALVVLAGSLAALGAIAYSYLEGQQKYEAIARDAAFTGSDIAQDENLDKLHVDWDALLAANPDTVAWVYMPGTPINYPVVQGQDNEHYLYRDFDGDAGWLAEYGAIFMDFRNDPKFTDAANFVYGHHMNDGSMFAVLSSFEDAAAFDEHRIAYVLTPQGNFRLQSFAIVHCAADDPIVETEFSRKADMAAYVQDKMDRSLVAASDVPAAKDIGQVFALATCDSYSAGRDVLFMRVLDTTAEGLTGEVGLDSNRNSTWFVDDIEEEG